MSCTPSILDWQRLGRAAAGVAIWTCAAGASAAVAQVRTAPTTPPPAAAAPPPGVAPPPAAAQPAGAAQPPAAAPPRATAPKVPPAAPPGPVGKGPRGRTKDPQQVEQARGKLLQQIRAMRTRELTQILQPDTVAIGKVVEMASGFEDRLIASRQELRAQRVELDRLLADPKPDDGAITRATDELLVRRRKLDDIETERTAALRKVLRPSQFARLVVAWPRINRKIHEQLYRALLSSKPGRGAVDED